MGGEVGGGGGLKGGKWRCFMDPYSTCTSYMRKHKELQQQVPLHSLPHFLTLPYALGQDTVS